MALPASDTFVSPSAGDSTAYPASGVLPDGAFVPTSLFHPSWENLDPQTREDLIGEAAGFMLGGSKERIYAKCTLKRVNPGTAIAMWMLQYTHGFPKQWAEDRNHRGRRQA